MIRGCGRACDDVRSSTLDACKTCMYWCTIDNVALQKEAAANAHKYSMQQLPFAWQQSCHMFDEDNPRRTAHYILVLETLNFCFWPLAGYEYQHLASALKVEMERDSEKLSPTHLASIEASELQEIVLRTFDEESSNEGAGAPVLFPLIDERARLLREVGVVLMQEFSGDVAALIGRAQRSAPKLVDLVTTWFPGFRDSCVFQGQQVFSVLCKEITAASHVQQVFLYKRAQNFVGHLWGAFKGQGLGRFDDISLLTCFSDYRLPQLLRDLGILVYSHVLSETVDSKTLIAPGSPEEIAIRSCTVQAVQRFRCALNARLAEKGLAPLNSVQIDWILWERAQHKKRELLSHPRVLTIFY